MCDQLGTAKCIAALVTQYSPDNRWFNHQPTFTECVWPALDARVAIDQGVLQREGAGLPGKQGPQCLPYIKACSYTKVLLAGMA